MIVAEFSMYCHWYVLQASRSGNASVVLVTDGEREKQIANSFEDFVNQYLSNPGGVAYSWAKERLKSATHILESGNGE